MSVAVRRRLCGEAPEKFPWKIARNLHPVLVCDPHAVNPDTLHADRRSSEAGALRRQVPDPRLRTAIYLRRIEEQQVGTVAGFERAAFLDSEKRSDISRELARGFGERQGLALAHPMPQEMQAEPGVVEERQVRARVRQRYEARGV